MIRRASSFLIQVYLSFAVVGIPLAGSGCASLWVAGGVAAGYAVSRDSVVLDLDRSWESVWDACLEEVRGQVREVDVALTLEQLTPATVRVVIRARKHLLPQVEVAQRLGLCIARRIG